ncbi:uncharacterized protein LOC128670251 [Plodia interpunctella]|uniref:uncharacterized protein LOC128670251 n=1 Tax=Plodia interpunctella TaxID=58824 RepID=UPI0023684BF6|nr:uncharacterized protein LOC128670251 [Plodia interpunctella]
MWIFLTALLVDASFADDLGSVDLRDGLENRRWDYINPNWDKNQLDPELPPWHPTAPPWNPWDTPTSFPWGLIPYSSSFNAPQVPKLNQLVVDVSSTVSYPTSGPTSDSLDPTSTPWYPTLGPPLDPWGPSSTPWYPTPDPTRDPQGPSSTQWYPTLGPPLDPWGLSSTPWYPTPDPTRDPRGPSSTQWYPTQGPTRDSWGPSSTQWYPTPSPTRDPWGPSSTPWGPPTPYNNIPPLPWKPEYVKYLKTNLLLWDHVASRIQELLTRARLASQKMVQDDSTLSAAVMFAVNKLALDLVKDCSPFNYATKYRETVYNQLYKANSNPMLAVNLMELLLNTVYDDTRQIRALLFNDEDACKKCGCQTPSPAYDQLQIQVELVLALSSLAQLLEDAHDLKNAIKTNSVQDYLLGDHDVQRKMYPLTVKTAKVFQLLAKRFDCTLQDYIPWLNDKLAPPNKGTTRDNADLSDSGSNEHGLVT